MSVSRKEESFLQIFETNRGYLELQSVVEFLFLLEELFKNDEKRELISKNEFEKVMGNLILLKKVEKIIEVYKKYS